MLEAARNREFQVLVVPDFDRFARSLVKGLILEEQLKKYGVRVVYQRVPVEDTPEGHLLKTQLYAFAEYERQKTRFGPCWDVAGRRRLGESWASARRRMASGSLTGRWRTVSAGSAGWNPTRSPDRSPAPSC